MNEKILKPSLGWKIFMPVIAVPSMALMGALGWFSISEMLKPQVPLASIIVFSFLILLAATMIFLFICGVLQSFRSCIIIRDSEIEYYSGIFKREKISASQIKSWTITRHYTFTYFITYSPDHENDKRLKIEMIFNNNELLGQWLNESCGRPSSVTANASITEEIQSENVELTEKDINNELSKYTKIAKFYNYASTAIAVIPLVLILVFDFSFKPIFRISVILNLIIFFTGFFLIKYSKEIIRVDEIQGQKFPSILQGLLLGFAINILESSSIINLMIDIKKYFLVSLIISVILLAIIQLFRLNQLSLSNKKGTGKVSVLCFYLLIVALVHGLVPAVNHFFCLPQEPQVFITTVTEKKGTETVYVSPWINSSKPKSIDVSKKTFNKIQQGNNIEIHIKKGLLGIRFYTAKTK